MPGTALVVSFSAAALSWLENEVVVPDDFSEAEETLRGLVRGGDALEERRIDAHWIDLRIGHPSMELERNFRAAPEGRPISR